ncbi:MAG: FixH family protein [bacterium]|nr:FixH family protein [bacterium]
MRRITLLMILVGMVLSSAIRASAHANLIESEPPANAVLETPPSVIRLSFTEPLEPAFSRIIVRGADGLPVPLPEAALDANDPYVLILPIPMLDNGTYSVEWRVVSAADGHPTSGAFPISIGAAGVLNLPQAAETPIPLSDSLIRWLNYLSHSLLIGGVGFWLFAIAPAKLSENALTVRAIQRLIAFAWVLLGISAALLLLMQAAVTAGVSISEALNATLLAQVTSGSRFGQLWMIRVALWGIIGVLLLSAPQRPFAFTAWGVLFVGLGSQWTTSLFSHAAGAPTDQGTAMAATWLHFAASALWIGGLFQFLNVLVTGSRSLTAHSTAALIGHFSSYARVTVAAVVLTGWFAAWLHIQSPGALVETRYGQLMLIKLVLFAPALALAGVNLVITQRRLAAGQPLWIGRLRGLISAEIVLTVTILGIVGVMTSSVPARIDYQAQQARAAAQVPPNPISETLTQTGVSGTLTITPGYTGANTFTLTLTDRQGHPVTDASRIRLTFRSQVDSGAESELRMEHRGDGVYEVAGANLTRVGAWRVRAVVARDGDFDRVYDFRPAVELPPPVPVIRAAAPDAPLPNRITVLLLIGVIAVGSGGFFLGETRWRVWRGSGFVAAALVLIGIAFLVSSLSSTLPA